MPGDGAYTIVRDRDVAQQERVRERLRRAIGRKALLADEPFRANPLTG